MNWKITVLVALIGAAGVIIAALVARRHREPPPGPAGTILAPGTGESVARSFMVEGTLSGIPSDRHVWVAVQIGNLLFPKEPEIPSGDQHWIQDIVEGGSPPGGVLSLVLLTVDADGQQGIEAWLGRGRQGEGLPGLPAIPGSVKLAVVGDVVLEES